jgi:hypothetical protein
VRGRAGRALASAALAGEFGALAEQRSRQGPAIFSEMAARLAVIHRRSQRCHDVAAQLNAAYAGRLSNSAHPPGGLPGAAFLLAVASVSGGSRVVLTLAARDQAPALVAATDDVAQTACDLELGCGEGPATDAVARRRLVEAPGDLAAVWPRYGRAVNRLGIQAVSAAPLWLHGHCLGSVTKLDQHPAGHGSGARADQLADALVYALLAGDILADRRGLPSLPLPGSDRALMHQAAGIVAAESGLEIADALALIRARAFADSQPDETIAARIVGRRLHLTITD